MQPLRSIGKELVRSGSEPEGVMSDRQTGSCQSPRLKDHITWRVLPPWVCVDHVLDVLDERLAEGW